MIIPPGFGTMFPYIIVSNAKKYVEFLEQAFGAIEITRTERPDGTIANSILKIGTTSFMVSQTNEPIKETKSSFYIFVENADAAHKKALACHAVEIFAPMDMPYEDRQSGVTDPFGNRWWISQRLVEGPYK